MSLLKAIISTLTDAKVDSGQKLVNPVRSPPRHCSPTQRAFPVANRWPRGAPTGSTAPGWGSRRQGGVVGIWLFCGGISSPAGPAVTKAARAAWPSPKPPAHSLPVRLGLCMPLAADGAPGMVPVPRPGRAELCRASSCAPPLPLLLGYL